MEICALCAGIVQAYVLLDPQRCAFLGYCLNSSFPVAFELPDGLIRLIKVILNGFSGCQYHELHLILCLCLVDALRFPVCRAELIF